MLLRWYSNQPRNNHHLDHTLYHLTVTHKDNYSNMGIIRSIVVLGLGLGLAIQG